MGIIIGASTLGQDGVGLLVGNSGLLATPTLRSAATAPLSGMGSLYSSTVNKAALGGTGKLKASALVISLEGPGPIIVTRYMGDENAPPDVRRMRRSVWDIMRRFGNPVLVKHMFNADDVTAGIAQPSPNLDPVYGQSRNFDPLSHGIGYCSVERSSFEWITPDGEIMKSQTRPGPGYVPAPLYRGFGPGYLFYVIQPDVAEDFFKVVEGGALIKVQTAQVQAPWFPDMNDNDLMINVTLDRNGEIVETHERFQLKMTNPVSMRGYDRRGRKERGEDGGNRFIINQIFEMTLVPEGNTLHNVETDR